MPRNEITNAVRTLRKRLGDTQQQFAHRMGMAISTVVRYELTRPPRGKVLNQLTRVAEENGCPEQAELFRRALESELDLSTLKLVLDMGLTPENPREQEIVQAVLWASRSSNEKLLQNFERRLLHEYRRDKAKVEDVIEEAVKLYINVGAGSYGESLEPIAAKFSLPVEDVRLWSAVYRSIEADLSLLRRILYRISLGASSAWVARHYHIPVDTAMALEKLSSKLFSNNKRIQRTHVLAKKSKERNKK